MREYIEKQAFVDCYRKSFCDNCGKRRGMKNGKVKVLYQIGDAPCRACDIDDMITAVEDFTSSDVAPVRRGRWEKFGTGVYQCSCQDCRTLYVGIEKYKFCPNCGAKMEDGHG